MFDPRCEGNSCGNGVIDSCTDTLLEDCDGDAIEDTCAALGYVGGGLKCDSRCRYDRSDCHICLNDDRATACGLVPMEPAPAGRPRAAVGFGRIALAFSSRTVEGTHFTFLDDDLLPTMSPRCIGAGYPRDLEVGRDGWWLVLQHEKLEGQVVALDPEGEVRAVRPLGPHFDSTLNTRGTFPLLLYTDADFPDGTAASRSRAVAERLESDGSARWQVELPFDNFAVGGFSSLAVRGGYLVATPGFYTATLVRVSANGELTVADDRLRGVIGVRLFEDEGPIAVYTKLETLERVWVRRLDAYGRPQSEPVEIARSDVFSTSLVRSGRLLDVHGAIVDGRDLLEVRWFDLATGDLQSPAWPIAEIPLRYQSGTYHMGVTIADLPDPVVFWTRGDLVEGLMAARIRG